MSDKHSTDTRMQACAAYLVEGDSKRVSRLTGVPSRTIREWTTQDWWSEATQKLRAQYEKRLDAKLVAIMDMAFSVVLDRLEHGDEVQDAKSGTMTRRKISGRDAVVIGAVAFDKRALLRGQPTSRVERVDLDKLRVQFSNAVERIEDGNEH